MSYLMSDLMSLFFGPLDKSGCIYFFIISVIFFVGFVFLLFSEAYYIIKNAGKIDIKIISNGTIILFNMFIAYFVNRMLYTMCTTTLH